MIIWSILLQWINTSSSTNTDNKIIIICITKYNFCNLTLYEVTKLLYMMVRNEYGTK